MISTTSLANHRFKFLGLAIAGLGMILLSVLSALDYSYVEGWRERIFMINHFVIILGMVMIMYSRESNDDERVKLIRDSLLKFFFALLICGISLYIMVTSLDRVQGSLFMILYLTEAILAGYLVTFRISLITNPAWIFKQPEAVKERFIMMSISLLFLIGWIIFAVITYKI